MYNSDGYVMIDMSDVDLTRSSQNIPGIYKRVLEVIDTNKLALIVNAGNNTPMAAVVHKKLNYYKITTLLYIFTINTNDIVIVEESGEATVDVEIVPTLTSGTKIADFSIGSIEGELYAPTQQSEINDNVTAVNSTWSSTKISTELSAKADTSDLATVATTGAYSDLTGTPTIPTKVSELQNDSGYVPSTSLAAVATSGAYSDLTGTPTIPTKVSELQNDSGYVPSTSLAAVATSGAYSDLTGTPTIPTKVSELQNDSGYITNSITKESKSYASGIAKSGSGLTMTTYNKIVFISGYLNTNTALSQNDVIANLGITLKEQVFFTGYINGGGIYGMQIESNGSMKVQHSIGTNVWLNFSAFAILN